MKKTITTLFALLIGISFAFTQQIQRDKVLVEIGTGTWCQYCPGAAMGADDLVANGHDVAIIENHNGDAYTNNASNARNSYYGITGYPTAVFDGLTKVPGGSTSQSMYPQYLSKYNQKIAIPSSFSIDIQGSYTGMIDFDIDVTVEMVDPYAGSNIRLHCVVTESEIVESWQGQSHLNFVQRMMVPTSNGISLDFSGGNTIVENYSFSLDPSWVTEHCELVIFLQDNTTKEVLNASKKDMMEFENLTDYDVTMISMSNIPEASCAGMITPSVNIRNQGNVDLTSLTLKCIANGNELATYDWTGNVAFLGNEHIDLPSFLFPVEEVNDITIYAMNPNGTPDEFPMNDTIRMSIEQPEPVPTDVSLMIMLDDNPGETTWELMDDQGTVLYSGGPYSTPNGVIEESFELADLSCYQFYFYDAGGDGLGDKFFALFHGSGTIILRGIGDFGYSIATDFSTDDDLGIEDVATEAEVMVYPNPFSNYTNMVINTNKVSQINVNMYNILGELVFQSDEGIHAPGEQSIRISGDNLENGIYFVQVMVNEQVITKRVTLAR
jgi:hypothetical protein